MRIINLHLTNFKRFTDLRIEAIPPSAKLVLLIGSNGSGKSSVFDAFGFLDSSVKLRFSRDDNFWAYFHKKPGSPTAVTFQCDGQPELTQISGQVNDLGLSPTAFYGRTSFRQIPRLTRTSLGQAGTVDFEKDSDRAKYFIDRDNRFENDIEHITGIILNDFFLLKQSNEEISRKYINPINAALENIFGSGDNTKLQLTAIIPPLEGKVAQVNFRKGSSEIHYNYLSAGEKEVVNLLINLLSRGSLYQDTIYFLDEIDLHLNTKLQFNLLKEITENWIPESCQLWTATHSLGFIEYANQTEMASIIDFDDLDFDLPKILSPEPKDNPDVYEIAVSREFLPSLFKHMTLYFVENNDKNYYASIGLANTLFIPENNRNSVYHKVRTTAYSGIVDRDFLSDDDIIQIRKFYPNLIILNYYSVENYLYHPENLVDYFNSKQSVFDLSMYINQLTVAKNEVKDTFIPTLALKRTEYPYFGEPEYNGKPLQNRFKNKQENTDQSITIAQNLNSDDFETYYKSLPMKTYCTQLPQRQNVAKSDLSKTKWFKHKIEELLYSQPLQNT